MNHVLAAMLIGSAFPCAGAIVINVNSVADVNDAADDLVCETSLGNGICTLRAAVREANFNAFVYGVPVVINLPAGGYVLTLGELVIAKSLITLAGAGAGVTTIDGGQIARVLHVSGAGNTVAVSGVTITGGKASNALGDSGGGILNSGAFLTVSRCVVRNSVATNGAGGGIYSNSGTLTVVDSAVQGNTAFGNGGGIFGDQSSTTIERSTLSGNSADYAGGAEQYYGSLKIVNSTIGSNSALVSGGGLRMYHVVNATLNNVTVVGNVADSDFDGIGDGGGLDYQSSSIFVANSVFNNYNYYTQGNDDLASCGSTTVTSNGFNIIEAPGTCAVLGAYSQADFAYGPLLDNGGLSRTNALPAGSVAINAGNSGGCTDSLGAPLTTDQRGVKRSLGGRCDLGAFEAEPIGDVNGDGAVNVSDVFYLINFLFAAGPVPVGRANVNGDSVVGVGDAFYLINFLFAGGAAPA